LNDLDEKPDLQQFESNLPNSGSHTSAMPQRPPSKMLAAWMLDRRFESGQLHLCFTHPAVESVHNSSSGGQRNEPQKDRYGRPVDPSCGAKQPLTWH
jgi:hypothetical protein